MGIDFGLRRTGLAVSDPLKMFGSPLETVDTSKIIDYLKQYLTRESIELFILGEPKNLQGGPTDSSEAVAKFKLLLEKEFPQIPVKLIDERLTSRMAKDTLLAAGYKKSDRRDKKLLDTISAALILQTYLDTK